MKTKKALATLLAVVSISSLACPRAHAVSADQTPAEDAPKGDQTESETPMHVQQFVDLLRNDHEFNTSHVFSREGNARRAAMKKLRVLSKSFQASADQKIVATKVIGDFSLSIINLDGKKGSKDRMVNLLMMQQDDGWKFISESNIEVDSCRRMFDRCQLGAFFTLMMWAEENGLES